MQFQGDGDSKQVDEFGDPRVFSQPHAYLRDSEILEDDIFNQEFFLHIYSLFAEDRQNFVESEEGMTYVKLRHHDKVIVLILPLIRGPSGDLQKWSLKVRRMLKRMKGNRGKESDYFDLDLIMGMVMEEFKKQRS
jgi:hypothetical protein